jgi:hypothetical protein
MTRYSEGGCGLTPETASHHQHSRPALTKTSSHHHDNSPLQYLGRYALGWRHGFRAGAADALRLAARRLPPEAWNVLDKLADAYELAASDE